jgi:Methyltransferase domain
MRRVRRLWRSIGEAMGTDDDRISTLGINAREPVPRTTLVSTPAAGYLDHGYLAVRGMSSLFAARIIVGLLRRQSAMGIAGHIAEIGVFEGRLLIAMALSLADGERALAIDPFTWPDLGLRGRFETNCVAHGVPAGRLAVLQRDSRSVTPRQLLNAAGGGIVRFLHIDGEHTAGHLASDLRLAAAVAAPDGVLALDDMLHPVYPTLALTVHAFLGAEPDWRVLAIIDREDIVGAAKYLLCRKPATAGYEAWLRSAFAAHVLPMDADFESYRAVVITPEPKLADIG